MENPATWNKATQVISDALGEADRQAREGIIGHSTARIVHDALEREGLLAQNGGWISVERRVDKAFDLIARANTVTLLSLDEMEALVNRALAGEFDPIIPATLGDGTICDEGLVRPIQPPLSEHHPEPLSAPQAEKRG